MYIGFNHDADSANSIKSHLFVFVISPVTHCSHIFALGVNLGLIT